MNDIVGITSSIIATGNRSPWATSVAVLRAVSVTMRNSAQHNEQFLNDAANWIDVQLDSTYCKSDQPLWMDLANAISKQSSDQCNLHEAILSTIADRIETRCEKGLDRDPCETADWLRSQAKLSTLRS